MVGSIPTYLKVDRGFRDGLGLTPCQATRTIPWIWRTTEGFESRWGHQLDRQSEIETEEGGDELLTFFTFPKAQWKTLRTTNTIERLHEEFRRRVKTQGSLPSEDAAVVLLFSLVASGQIRLRRIDGWRKIAGVLSQHTAVAA